MVPKVFWLRCETMKLERRSALTPSTVGQLIKDGFTPFVERDQLRMFDDEEFERVGCSLVDNNTWFSASLDIPIIGLKELATSDEPVPHTHTYFGRCYKGRSSVLSRFKRGGGTVYDLESFTDPYASEFAMVANVRAAFGGSGKGAKALVVGALGRCETTKGGPFEDLLHVDIFSNCISSSSAIPPFLTRDQLEAAGAHTEPTVPVDLPSQRPPLSVVSIDHLPSMLPREASEQFSSDLLLTLKEFHRRDTTRVWTDAKMFDDKRAEAAAERREPFRLQQYATT
ncbi:hypothetical protein EDD15DRAFT_2404192 [Pisolithus albus]|nr:hypothetical protein EDD15DRAFT_2404192 [Pisolithus albus]